MANVDRPIGARVVGTLSGSPWEASLEAFTLDGGHAAIGVGDLVQMTSDGYLDVYAAGETGFIGVCVGILPVSLGVVNGKKNNFMSSTEPTLTGSGVNTSIANATDTILVCTAPDAIIEMQEDGVGTPLTLVMVGSNVDIINVAGVHGTTGKSQMEIDSSTSAATNTFPLRLLGLVQDPDNELASVDATKPWARWLCTPANHFYSGLNVGL